MRVGIDVSELRPGAIGGVATACRLLLDAFRRHIPGADLEVTAFSPGTVVLPEGVRHRQTGGPARPWRWRRSRQLRAAAHGLDLFHSPVTAFPSLGGLPVTATVHELPFVENARLERGLRATAQWYWLSRAMGECRALVAPSQATLRQMRIAHPASAHITTVIPHPAPPAPPSEQHHHDGSILFVGRLDRRKCVEALLRGASDWAGQIRLAGPQTAAGVRRIRDEAARLGLSGRLLLLGPVDEATLDYLYRQACAVGLVSLSEGFGFPVLEALARGVPVLVAKGTGAAETGGDAALVVDPVDPETIRAALRRATDGNYRREIATAGPRRALQFPAERAARSYLEVFRRALAR